MALELKDIWHNSVMLSNERMAHILEHPEMRGQESKIVETLTQPEVVIQSQTDESVRLFHRFYHRLSIGDKYLCVVVKYTQNNIFIVTSYFTDKIKRGEVIWKR